MSQGMPQQPSHMRPQGCWTPPLSCPEVIWPHRPNCHWWSPSHKPLKVYLNFNLEKVFKLTSLFFTQMLGWSAGHESSSSGLASTSLAPPLTPLLATPPPVTVSRLQLVISSSGTADTISWKYRRLLLIINYQHRAFLLKKFIQSSERNELRQNSFHFKPNPYSFPEYNVILCNKISEFWKL